MCWSVPGKIIEIKGNAGTVDFSGVQKTIVLDLLSNPEVGEYVLVHAGYAIQKVNEENKLKQDVIVDISEASKEAQKIKEIILSEPDIREDKVADLKEKIDSGRYKVNNDLVADKIVSAFLQEIL